MLVGVDACVAFQVVCKAGRSSAPETIHQSNCRATNQSHSGQQYWSRERWSKIGSRDRVLSATNTSTSDNPGDNIDNLENMENMDNLGSLSEKKIRDFLGVFSIRDFVI